MKTTKSFKILGFLLSLLVLLGSCSGDNKSVSIPDHILSKEKYADVLVSLALTESAANLNIKNVKIEKLDSAYSFDPLKEKKISRAQFDSTASFYSEHPDLYKEVYDEVLKRLSEMESKRKVIIDSVKK
ncbi:MAG: DUF4296 domain-containing protein [Bacteroidetes bacterium]|nr:DUF4296 domain-containing protein [Bacteroidota bacterium]